MEKGRYCVCVGVYSQHVHMLISQIGDDDTQQAKINRSPLRWHFSAWSSLILLEVPASQVGSEAVFYILQAAHLFSV